MSYREDQIAILQKRFKYGQISFAEFHFALLPYFAKTGQFND